MRKFTLALAAVVALSIAAPAPAATQIVDGSGILTGASGVNVGGTLYDVFFSFGSCQTEFGGCNAQTDFFFQTAEDASLAAQALLDQVLLDTLAGNFDSNPFLTSGCQGSQGLGVCVINVPYLTTVSQYLSSAAFNFPSNSLDVVQASGGAADAPRSWATFLVSANQLSPIPETASWAMMLLGFGAIGFAMRRRKSVALA
jgi:hypothetical protein